MKILLLCDHFWCFGRRCSKYRGQLNKITDGAPLSPIQLKFEDYYIIK